MSLVDDLLTANERYAASGRFGALATEPTRQLVVVTCMDCRIDALGAFGLSLGEAHILRNAGGVVTDDVIRSLAISQRVLGTRHVVLVHHTRCGMLSVREDRFREQLLHEIGMKPPWPVEAFTDLEADLRSSISRVRQSPFLPHRDSVHGFLFDVDTGRLRLVDAPESTSRAPLA